MMDFQIFADMVKQQRIDEAERERIINAARAEEKNSLSFLGRLIRLLKSPLSGEGKFAKDSTPPIDLGKQEPAV